MTNQDLRRLFPELGRTVYGKPLVYLDNAATSLRPQSVIDLYTEMSAKYNANIHRAVHAISQEATDKFEDTRQFVADFLNVSPQEIIFTSGTTAGINLAAFCFGERYVSVGDEIIIAGCEHHSDIVPWQMMASRRRAVIKVLPVRDDGTLDFESLDTLITDKTRIVCVAQMSNVLGLENPISEIVRTAHSRGVRVMVDGAQGIVHIPTDLKTLDCDFYVFSGHKVYASTGVGVLYAKSELLEEMPPYMGGGEMIGHVKWSGTTYAEPPHKFEAGTQNIAGVPTLVPALKVLRQMQELREEIEKISKFIYNKLKDNKLITLYGDSAAPSRSLFSFTVKGVHHEDLALILDKMGIAVRSGQMCAEPLMDRFGVTGMVRASFAPYNTMQEAEYFIESLDKAMNMLL